MLTASRIYPPPHSWLTQLQPRLIRARYSHFSFSTIHWQCLKRSATGKKQAYQRLLPAWTVLARNALTTQAWLLSLSIRPQLPAQQDAQMPNGFTKSFQILHCPIMFSLDSTRVSTKSFGVQVTTLTKVMTLASPMELTSSRSMRCFQIRASLRRLMHSRSHWTLTVAHLLQWSQPRLSLHQPTPTTSGMHSQSIFLVLGVQTMLAVLLVPMCLW